MEAKKILKKHLNIHIPKGKYRSEKELIQLRYDASIDAINEALNVQRVSDSEIELCDKCNRNKQLKELSKQAQELKLGYED